MRNIPNADPSEKLYPHKYFDLIGGTSTGGLVALMLGRLGMDVDSAIEKYEELGSIIFGRDRGEFLGIVVRGAQFDVIPFEKELAKWLQDEYMLDPDLGNRCRVSPRYHGKGDIIIRPIILRTSASSPPFPGTSLLSLRLRFFAPIQIHREVQYLPGSG
jgi:hypothetical protein